MPAHNSAEFIAEAINSVLRQDYSRFELLVIDDGSTDGTGQVAWDIPDPRIRVIRREQGGITAALNLGLDHARGDLIARMDSDDLMMPGRLSAQVSLMAADPQLVVCGTDYELFGEMSGRVRMPRTDRACRDRLRLASCFCGGGVMIRREVMERRGIRYEAEFPAAEDFRLWTVLARHGRLANISMIGLRYRVHPGQVTSRQVDDVVAGHLRVLTEAAGPSSTIAEADLRSLLWPPAPAGVRGPARAAREVLRTAGPAGRLWLRRPGLEAGRFLSRKVYEAAARGYHGP